MLVCYLMICTILPLTIATFPFSFYELVRGYGNLPFKESIFTVRTHTSNYHFHELYFKKCPIQATCSPCRKCCWFHHLKPYWFKFHSTDKISLFCLLGLPVHFIWLSFIPDPFMSMGFDLLSWAASSACQMPVWKPMRCWNIIWPSLLNIIC